MQSPNLLFTMVAFAAMLGPLVFVHELGHYLVARWCGVRSEVFSIGFGRELAGWTDRAGTRWKLGMLPLGGYVQFAGDMNPASVGSDTDPAIPVEARAGLFQTHPVWHRALIVAAGPLINFLFAYLLLVGLSLAYGDSRAEPVIGTVIASSPASEAGLRAGDRVLAIDDKAVERFEDVSRAILMNTGTAVNLLIARDDRKIRLRLVPRMTTLTDRFGNSQTVAMIGIGRAASQPRPVGIAEAPHVAARRFGDAVGMMTRGIAQIVTGARSVKELGGPLQIARQSGEGAALGLPVFLWLMAMISLNLGLVNLIPLPLLDGGHLLFYAIEAVFRRPVSVAAQIWASRLGFAIIATLFVVVTVNDLGSFGLWKRLSGLIG